MRRSRRDPPATALLFLAAFTACGGDSSEPAPLRLRMAAAPAGPALPLYEHPEHSRDSGGPPGYGARRLAPAGAGLSFREVSSFLGVYDLVPGWGLSWCDADQDGDDDLYFANHMHYPSALYLNEGGLYFRAAGGTLGRDVHLDDHMGAWADADGDAWPDLYTANGFHRPDHLMRNLTGGRFQEITGKAGLAVAEPGRGRSALWADFDGNGWNDLLVLNLLTPDFLFFNDGGRFRDAALDSGLRNGLAKEGAVAGDLDGDGDLDVYLPVLRDGQRNLLFLNRGDGRFAELSAGSGADLPDSSHAAALGDYDNDGDLDLFVASHDQRPGALLRNRGDATFEDVTAAAGLTLDSAGARSAAFADLDNDGWLDLFVCCGGGLEGAVRPNALYRNRGDGSFDNCAAAAGVLGVTSGRSASAAFADYNGDGLLDFAATNGADAVAISGQNALYRNESSGAGGWLRVYAPASPGNFSGVGVRVTLARPGGARLVRHGGLVQTMGQDAEGVPFGLGGDAYAAHVVVEWPDGGPSCRQSVPAGERLCLPKEDWPVFLRSHPAALLGRAPLYDLAALAPKLAAFAQVEAEDYLLMERQDELLAYALAADVAANLSVGDDELQRAWGELAPRFRLVPRLWLEQVAIGPFTARKTPAPLRWEAGRRAAELLAGGADVMAVAAELELRAWARVYRPGESYEPSLGEADDSLRGYVEAGWVDERMLQERYGAAAAEIWELQPGEVWGPLPLREGRDVQDPETVWPLLRVFRVLAREEGAALERSFVEAELRRAVRRERLRAALEEAAPGACLGVNADSAWFYLEGLRCAVGPLAAAAARIGILERPALLQAMERIALESRCDAQLSQGAQQRLAAISEEQIAAYAAARAAAWTLPRSVRAVRVFAVERSLVESARQRLEAGEEPLAACAALEIPDVRGRSARATSAHFEDSVYSEPLIQRYVEDAAAVFTVDPGRCSEIQPSLDGHLFFYVREQIAALPCTPEEARGRALIELRRRELAAFAREMLGF